MHKHINKHMNAQAANTHSGREAFASSLSSHRPSSLPKSNNTNNTKTKNKIENMHAQTQKLTYECAGGKHTFWEGGVRVVSFLTSPLLPPAIRGTVFNGMAHSSDWYVTLVEGLAGGNVTASGPRPSDGYNLWPAMVGGLPSPRTEVVHQVNNSHFHALTGESFKDGVLVSKGDCDGCCSVAIRVDNWKLIIGDPGDDRWQKFPDPNTTTTRFGGSGGQREPGTDHCRSLDGHTEKNKNSGTYLFDLSTDLSERHNLAEDPAHAALISNLTARIKAAGTNGPPPAYVYFDKAAQQQASDLVCKVTESIGCLEPGDVVSPPVPPGPAPSPSPASRECSQAGGILSTTGKEAFIACCASSCGTCGGKDCAKVCVCVCV